MTTPLAPFVTSSDFKAFGSNTELVQNTNIWTEPAIQRLLLQSTRAIESRCQRRLAPFSGKQESHEAIGIDPNEYGNQGSMPMDLTGALGWSQAASLGVSDMVRKFWLDENPPMFQDLWSYSLESIEILRTFGDTSEFQRSDFTTLQGPEFDTGMIRMQIGTYCPLGSMIRVTYGGGYNPIPYDLELACVLQAMKFLLIGAEPEMRKDMSEANLDEELTLLLAPYGRS